MNTTAHSGGMWRNSGRIALALIAAGLCCCGAGQPLRAGEVLMKSGHRIRFEGKPAPLQGLTLSQVRAGNAGPVANYPYTMFDARSRRYYLPQSQIDQVQLGDGFVEEFELPVKPSARPTMFSSVGGFLHVEPFSEFGRRIVSLQGPDKPIDVVQAITRIRPDYVELTGINQNWQYSVATPTLQPRDLRMAISRAIDERNQQDRLTIVRLFIDAQMFREAQQELDQIAIDFPDLQNKVNQLQLDIRQLRALQFLNEFRRRLDAGQYSLVYEQTQRFPREEVNQATLDEVDRIAQKHREALDQLDQIRAELSRLQADVADPALLKRFRDMRSVVESRLSRTTLERLTPFRQNLEDDFLKPAEKLALAYSGWVAGPALAETDPDAALQLWDARDRVLEFLRSDNPLQQTEILTRLRSIEGVGPDVVAAIVAQLGPIYETPAITPGQPLSLTARSGQGEVPYRILLPVEYSPDRKYPVVLALHARGMAPEQELFWWGGNTVAGPAHRYGYIVVAPEYTPAGGGTETAGEEMHRRVVDTLRDVRRRFAADSDRVFLVGHSEGGDAVFDLGMAHPDLFAGAVAITARTNEFARQYWENSRHLPFYVVSGELDGDSFAANAEDLSRMMRNRFDVVLTEFKQRGREDYQEELPHILDWMALHRRAPLPLELTMKTMRPSDNRFYWFEFAGLPAGLIDVKLNRYGNAVPPRALPIEAKVTEGNTIYLTAGADRISLWLSPDVISFEKKLKVRWKGRTVYSEIPERDIRTMLEHLAQTGDRERLYWSRLDF